MMQKIALTLVFVFMVQVGHACTNFLITKGASADGRNYIFYANDGAYAPSFPVHPAAAYRAGDSVHIVSYPNKKEGYLPRAAYEYHTIGYHMNEHHVTIGETTFGGRKELHNTDEFLEYWHLMELGLRRSKSARQMIEVITSLVAKYGYGSEGQSFSIADPDEVWILEMIGKGVGQKGAVWVAVRVPDGTVSAHANHSRVGSIDLNDTEHVRHSPDVVDFAVSKGYYHPGSGKPFNFSEAYDPATPAKLRYTEMRVWDFFHRVAPSLSISPDYARGVFGASPMPLWILPDRKLTLEEVMQLTRSHYDGTPWDMEQGLKAGPFGSPHYSRPLTFKVDDRDASWERPISTPLTAYAFIAQLSSDRKPETQSVLWLGLDNSYTNVYIPFHCSVTEIPESYHNADYNRFDWNSMWWVFNFVGNYVNLRYSDMIADVKLTQQRVQSEIIRSFRAIEKRPSNCGKKCNCTTVFTEFGAQQSKQLLADWTALAHQLIVKYNDGLVRDEKMHPRPKGYSEAFYRMAVEDDPERLLPDWPQATENLEPRNY